MGSFRKSVKIVEPLGLVLLLVLVVSAAAQVSITVETIGSPNADGTPNTFMGTGRDFASSLLGSSEPAIMWGVVDSSDVNAICTNIVNTGSLTFTANVDESGATEPLTMQVTNVGGCLAAADGSGTQAVIVDNTGRKSALVCPDNAGTLGCAVYFTGTDVTTLYNTGTARRRLMASRKLLQDACLDGAAQGAISGAATGVLDSGSCAKMGGRKAAFCIAGNVGANAGVQAVAGCASAAASSCFPGDAVVTLASGEMKSMTTLALGDKVAVKRSDGGVAYEDVYAFGHKDATAEATYLRLTLANAMAGNKTLELTSLHFAPVMSSGMVVYKRAQDIVIGDQMWGEDEKERISPSFVVKSIDTVVKAGLYNPFTLGGTIIVNGVVASTHSEWFLDEAFEAMGWTHWLPAAYQLILSPIRVLYHVLGKQVYIRMYQQLDSLVDIAHFGTNYGAHFAMSLVSGSCLMALITVRKASPGY